MREGRVTIVPGCVTALLLSACAGTRVLVQDPAGGPIAGAKVMGDTASITIGPVVTNARGEARVPWSLQDVWWFRASADGYCPTSWTVEVREKRQPVTIVLRPSAPGEEHRCRDLLQPE